MKISKVKLLGVVLAAMLLMVAAVGCADSGTENGDTEQTETLEGNITIAGSTSVQPLSEELASAFMEQNQGVEINVAGGGSGAGIKAAQEGTADIGASSRELKEEEKGLNETVIAKDGIAIVIHPDNAVEGLTLEETQKYLQARSLIGRTSVERAEQLMCLPEKKAPELVTLLRKS